MTYEQSVEHYLECITAVSSGANHMCPECDPDNIDGDTFEQDYPDEGGFSWSHCEGCGSAFGGDRYAGHGLIDGELIHLQLCTDCLLYLVNGDEPEEPWFRSPEAARRARLDAEATEALACE
ncbi:hypothetical protein LCGC14_1258600 [marine sediment metagenome]|uniref:Uncharacterized protein n=1 Tax=marine sediment metagenome TaxID=412755 RepID=A0A0F9NI27_9ZZZZ